ncbi:hypothetical protein J9536_12610 [Enterococcus hirae]|uniref:hypothetical protein n=1 Tax=Enterococcus hirae TaxID=1354 RepID=UPI001C48C018|nr:hypothetical protein [Enterococcus hirae]MBV6974042.1 hypothetical protein [Enterococcus hirae]
MPNKEQEKTKTIQQEPTELNPSTTKEKENSPFISKKRAKELKKFESKVRKKENKAVEQVIAKVMKNRAIPRSSVLRYLKNELKKSPHISRQRVEEEMGKYEGGNNVRNSSEVPVNKGRGEDLKEKLNRVSKEENSSPGRASVSQDLQHNPLHR